MHSVGLPGHLVDGRSVAVEHRHLAALSGSVAVDRDTFAVTSQGQFRYTDVVDPGSLNRLSVLNSRLRQGRRLGFDLGHSVSDF